MKKYLEKVMAGNDLTQSEMTEVFDLIMTGQVTPVQIAGFIVALRIKGETAAEIAGGAASMRQHAVMIDDGGMSVVDTCGTGGDCRNTFNISTTAALVAAGAGIPIAKHGNRCISSKCGSADLLTQLGVNLEISPEVVSECIKEAGIGFMFAPKLHPAMKYAMPARKELGVRTIFNMLGPLTNPARARFQLLGVFLPELTELFANVLNLLKSEKAFVVHGNDGMDEITTITTTRISELADGVVRSYDFDPLEFINSYASAEDIQGGTPEENATITRDILAGSKGPKRDIVCINAAAAIVAGGKADNMEQGWEIAQSSIDQGSATRVLDKLVEVSNKRDS